MQTLRHTMQVLDYVKSKGIEVKFHGRAKNEASHYCGVCEVSDSTPISMTNFINSNFFYRLQHEVFNVLFIREQEKRHVVHCMGCARKQSPSLQGFVCLEEYKLTELMQVYDAFIFHRPPANQLFVPPPTPLPQQQQTIVQPLTIPSVIS